MIVTVLIVFAFARKGIAAWLPLPPRRPHGATLRLSVCQQQWRVYLLHAWLVLRLVLGLAGVRLLLS